MLRESMMIQQREGEPRRRWFFGDGLDLVIWVDDGEQGEGRVVAFHLLYDLRGDERVFMWAEGGRLRHFRVDDGQGPGRHGMAPVPTVALPPDAGGVAARFERECSAIDPRVAATVLSVLRPDGAAKE